jgi:hypothetical protein
LVSKAIVQAVEQQEGRFLERSRKDGFWYPVPYKRSVDKTSQGLRERDRDEDDEKIALPHQFAGTKAHALSDLADVAMAHASRMDGLPRSASQLVTAPGGLGSGSSPSSSSNNKNKNNSKPSSNQSNTTTTTTPTPPKAGKRSLQSLPPAKRTIPQRSLPLKKKARTLDSPSDEAKPSPVPPPPKERFAPIAPTTTPPTLEPRHSSMMRLLRDAQLMEGESPWAPTQNNMAASQAAYANQLQQLQQQSDRDLMARLAASPGAFPPLYGFSPSMAPSPASMPFPPGAAAAVVAAAAQNAGLSHTHQEAAAPALTRLTSQVSEWLTSFWPVATRGESLAGRTALLAHAAAAAPPLPTTTALAPGQVPPKGQTPVIFTVPRPEPVGPIEINTIPPLFQTRDGVPPPTRAAAATESTTSSIDPDFLLRTSSGAEDRPPPTELEQSVSTTLLSLAATPSRLFSGISGLFGDGPEDTAKEPPPAGGGKRSLLDDHEDTPQEARLRASLKRNKPSLLDDYEETPMEARMRSVYR